MKYNITILCLVLVCLCAVSSVSAAETYDPGSLPEFVGSNHLNQTDVYRSNNQADNQDVHQNVECVNKSNEYSNVTNNPNLIYVFLTGCTTPFPIFSIAAASDLFNSPRLNKSVKDIQELYRENGIPDIINIDGASGEIWFSCEWAETHEKGYEKTLIYHAALIYDTIKLFIWLYGLGFYNTDNNMHTRRNLMHEFNNPRNGNIIHNTGQGANYWDDLISDYSNPRDSFISAIS